MNELKIYLPKKIIKGKLIASVACLLSGILHIFSDFNQTLVWSIIACCILSLFLQPFLRKPKIVINTDGIYKIGFFTTKFISWDFIIDAYRKFFLHLEYIHIVIDRNVFPLTGRFSGLKRFFGLINEKIEISIFELDAEKFIPFIIAMKDTGVHEREEVMHMQRQVQSHCIPDNRLPIY